MDDSIAAFVNSVNIADSTILNTPNFIFLCGGRTQAAGPFLSGRDYFNRHINTIDGKIAGRVKLAEAINDWFDHDRFSDLLELEGYLADISDLIILFVESAGSIAELGSFATSDALQPKTLAVLNSTHPLERTFIADGPVRRIQTIDESMVLWYQWNDKDLSEAATLTEFADMSNDLVQLLVNREAASVKVRKLNLGSHGHIMLLIADLVELVGITLGTELLDCLSAWGIALDRTQLQKYISLLKHLHLITAQSNGNQTYYLSRISAGFIHYAFIPKTPTRDRARVKSLIRQAMATRDERRARILQKHLLQRSKWAKPNV